MKPSVNVVYSDNHLVVADKPAGWLTQPDGSGTPDLETALKQWIKETCHKPGAVFLHAIHRLDRPVGGLVLFARTSKALTRLNEQVRAQAIERFYTALVEGELSESGQLAHRLLHGEHRARVSNHPDAKLARLTYRVEHAERNETRVAIELETGRYHQIRAQFAAIGHPIVGDGKYGAKEGDGRVICLHCAEIRFEHPVSKERLTFSCSPRF